MTNSDEMEHDQSDSSKFEKKETVIDRDDPNDDVSDRDQFSHHPRDKMKMGDCGEHRPSRMVADGTDTLSIEREVLKEEQADASVIHPEVGIFTPKMRINTWQNNPK